ncbi:exported hypothetical protein [Vibrio nigripulchritudo SO65]|nr:exported hypothetical protein [Vibrio nigripulchritudo AM115]CCN44246.1 exported hypothetical protein [Vibrio nigripulchritudo FTn2]CCN67730.1 exported hypothetical protein [Vibrio nigripulchritudo POn4]CCN76019.1 exported hypothetical protein [Vibrio nigripulchritudo SO65]
MAQTMAIVVLIGVIVVLTTVLVIMAALIMGMVVTLTEVTPDMVVRVSKARSTASRKCKESRYAIY